MKKLLIAAAALATMASATLPAAAAPPSATVKIQWNIASTASIVMQGNYTNTGTGGSDNLSPLVDNNGGSGTCAGGGAGGAGNGTQALTLDFGAITPDPSQVTGCIGLNAAEAQINTNDTNGVKVQEALTTAPGNAGVSICGIAVENNGPVAWAASSTSSSNYTAAKATDTADATGKTWAGSTCAGLTYNGVGVNAVAEAAAAATTFWTSDNTTNPSYFGEDYAVLIPANAPKVASDSGTITYTVLVQ
ncbi:MAG TPA: hypothetical protein VFA29_00900 [Candidatus Baltobacteraceae bacterium]|nr:hypothetical protein [Candidatus Baltobacteraceae bacterium]